MKRVHLIPLGMKAETGKRNEYIRDLVNLVKKRTMILGKFEKNADRIKTVQEVRGLLTGSIPNCLRDDITVTTFGLKGSYPIVYELAIWTSAPDSDKEKELIRTFLVNLASRMRNEYGRTLIIPDSYPSAQLKEEHPDAKRYMDAVNYLAM